MKRLATLLLGSLLLGLAGTSAADTTNQAKPERIYDVEIILFRNEAVPKGRETVPPSPSPALPKDSIDFANPASASAAADAGFRLLAASELQLKAERERLDKSRRYRVLLHLGWRQPGLSAADARAIRIRGGRYYDASYASIDQGTRSANATTLSQRGLYELEGWIRVSLARYLHTEANLVLREPAQAGEPIDNREPLSADSAGTLQEKLLINYPLKEKRRMRSKRLHYLDHPEYGLVVLITPWKAAASSPAAPASSPGKPQ